MRLLEGRAAREDGWDLNGGQPRGPKVIIRGAKDPVTFPTDPGLLKTMTDNMCLGQTGEDCYILKNVYDDTRKVRYGASVEEWNIACKELLDIALEKSLTP